MAELLDECWELIFSFTDHHQQFESLSLVCKQFLSITNFLRHSLKIIDTTTPLLPKLFKRFLQLKKIDLCDFHGDINDIVSEIARSKLDLEEINISNQRNFPVQSMGELASKMKNLKILKCSRLSFLEDRDLVVIASSVPWLEELDISYPQYDSRMQKLGFLTSNDGGGGGGIVTDAGIQVLSTKLKNLRRVNISGNQFISDRSLVSLSSNCVLLTEIAVRDCCFLTQQGIGFLMQSSPNLFSISFDGIGEISSPNFSATIKDSFVYLRALRALELFYSSISDEFLLLIAKAHLPLKRLTLSHCYNFTFFGISSLLYAYQSLTHLTLERVDFLTDQHMGDLWQFLCNVISISLNLCPKLTNSTLFTLIRKCHLLNHIEMERTNLGGEVDFSTDFVILKNPQVNSLKLARNTYLRNECIEKIASACPNLQMLDLSYCSGVSEQGMVQVFRKCSEIRHLEVNGCGRMKKLGIESDFCKLEILRAQGSGINDEALAMIGKRCPGLLQFNLKGCLNVTASGVKEMLKNCRVLKEINLELCDNVDVDIVAWIVFSRPSLRKLIPPSGFVPTENQRNLFLRHGCLIVCKAK